MFDESKIEFQRTRVQLVNANLLQEKSEKNVREIYFAHILWSIVTAYAPNNGCFDLKREKKWRRKYAQCKSHETGKFALIRRTDIDIIQAGKMVCATLEFRTMSSSMIPACMHRELYTHSMQY